MKEKITCPYCGANITSTTRRCEYCGCDNPYYNPKDFYNKVNDEQEAREQTLRNNPKYARMIEEYEQLKISTRTPAWPMLVMGGVVLLMMVVPISMSAIMFGKLPPTTIFVPILMSGIFVLTYFLRRAAINRAKRRMKHIEEELKAVNLSYLVKG